MQSEDQLNKQDPATHRTGKRLQHDMGQSPLNPKRYQGPHSLLTLVVLVNAWVIEVGSSTPPIISNHALSDLLWRAHHTPHTHLLNKTKEVLNTYGCAIHTTAARRN
jgi:hypothetical protein